MPPKLRSGGKDDAASRLAAGREFLESAEEDLAHNRPRAATAHAAESAIASSDVIAYAGAGYRSAGPSHQAALDVLAQAGEEEQVRDDLASALESKDPAQYSEAWIPELDTVQESLQAARRLLARAEEAFRDAAAVRWAGPAPDDPLDGTVLRHVPRPDGPRIEGS